MLLLTENGSISHLSILVLGAENVGKTALINAFLKQTPLSTLNESNSYLSYPETSSTIQLQIPFRPPHSGETEIVERVTLTLLEISGSPVFSSLYPSAIAAADAFMLVYNVADLDSFDSIWPLFQRIVETKCCKSSDIPIVLVGNKVDTVASAIAIGSGPSDKVARQVSTTHSRSLAKALKIPQHETTAKAPQSVSQIFKNLIAITQEKAYSTAAVMNISVHPSQQPPSNRSSPRRQGNNGNVSSPIQHFALRHQLRRPSQASIIFPFHPTGAQSEINESRRPSNASSTTVSSPDGPISTLPPPLPESIRQQRDLYYKQYIALAKGFVSKPSQEERDVEVEMNMSRYERSPKNPLDSAIYISDGERNSLNPPRRISEPAINQPTQRMKQSSPLRANRNSVADSIATRRSLSLDSPQRIRVPEKIDTKMKSKSRNLHRGFSSGKLMVEPAITSLQNNLNSSDLSMYGNLPSPTTPLASDAQISLQNLLNELEMYRLESVGVESADLSLSLGRYSPGKGKKTGGMKRMDSAPELLAKRFAVIPQPPTIPRRETKTETTDDEEFEEEFEIEDEEKRKKRRDLERKRQSIKNVGLLKELLEFDQSSDSEK